MEAEPGLVILGIILFGALIYFIWGLFDECFKNLDPYYNKNEPKKEPPKSIKNEKSEYREFTIYNPKTSREEVVKISRDRIARIIIRPYDKLAQMINDLCDPYDVEYEYNLISTVVFSCCDNYEFSHSSYDPRYRLNQFTRKGSYSLSIYQNNNLVTIKSYEDVSDLLADASIAKNRNEEEISLDIYYKYKSMALTSKPLTIEEARHFSPNIIKDYYLYYALRKCE